MSQWFEKPPTISGEIGTAVARTQRIWVKLSEGAEAAPALVFFQGGVAKSVGILGFMYTHFPSDIYSWGPRVELPPDTESPEVTLEEARTKMMSMTDKGASCPCCGRLVKLYRRKLHTEMALFLLKLVRAFKEEPRWYSTRELVPSTTKASTDGSYLVHWGLIEREAHENESGAKAGKYRPTEKGIRFAEGEQYVRSHLHLLCGNVVGFGGDVVTIKECLGSKFDYEELKSGLSQGSESL